MADTGPVRITDARSYSQDKQSDRAVKELAMRLGYRIAG